MNRCTKVRMLECRQEEQEKAHMDFAEKLKTLRKDSGLTQQEVADKIYVSRSLYAKYESGLSVPNKETLQKMALLFNTGVNDLISSEETTFMVVEEQKTVQTLKNVTLIGSSVICVLYIVFYFIPLFTVYSYQYPVPPGEEAHRIMRLMSSFSLLNEKGVPVGNVTLGLCIIEMILSILCLTIFNKTKIVVRYAAYVMFAASVFMVFMTIAFSCGFSA